MVMKVVVTVPMKDETYETVGRCYDAINCAAAQLRADMAEHVSVTICSMWDGNVHGDPLDAPIVHREHVDLIVTTHEPGISIGEARNLALSFSDADYVFSTDADCIVGPYWMTNHIQVMGPLAAASTGIVDLPGDSPKRPAFRRRMLDMPHSVVFEQNMAFRGGAFRRVGGFPAVSEREGPSILRALMRLGYPVVSSHVAHVVTSDRVSHRVKNGFSSMVAQL